MLANIAGNYLMSYFYDCKTKEEAKTRYRDLAKKFHPDHGGDVNQMVNLQKQYQAFIDEKLGEQLYQFNTTQKPFSNTYYNVNMDNELHNLRQINQSYRENLNRYTDQIERLNVVIKNLNTQINQLNIQKKNLLTEIESVNEISKMLHKDNVRLKNRGLYEILSDWWYS